MRSTTWTAVFRASLVAVMDLVRLHEMGLYGAIVGKAYYTGQVDLAEAVKQC